jgi:hypothetical protein
VVIFEVLAAGSWARAIHAAIGKAMASPAAKRLMRVDCAYRYRLKKPVFIKASLRKISCRA